MRSRIAARARYTEISLRCSSDSARVGTCAMSAMVSYVLCGSLCPPLPSMASATSLKKLPIARMSSGLHAVSENLPALRLQRRERFDRLFKRGQNDIVRSRRHGLRRRSRRVRVCRHGHVSSSTVISTIVFGDGASNDSAILFARVALTHLASASLKIAFNAFLLNKV